MEQLDDKVVQNAAVSFVFLLNTKQKSKPVSHAATQAKSKEKKKAIAAGERVLTLYEQACGSLADHQNDANELLKKECYKNLTNDERIRLKATAKKRRQTLKKKERIALIEQEEEEKVLPNEDSASIAAERLSHMVSTFFNEFNLDPSLGCLKRQNQHNQIAFYQFVLSLPKCPIPSFLQMLSDVIASEEGVDQKLRLFHAFCGLYDGKWIGNFEELCIPAVEYLASTQQIADRHAQGFLRYAFVNGVDLDCGSRVAAIFDGKFSHVWLQLGISLWSNLYDQSMFNSLPSTIMAMRSPLIQALKNASLAAIPPVFFKVALGILTYSCTCDDSLFHQLLFQFNEPLIKNYMKAETTSFLTLCSHLEKEMVTGNKLWFARPRAVIELLKGAHELIQKGKVPGGCFTKDVCQDLLNGGCVKQFIDRPSYKKHSSDDNEVSQVMLAVNEPNKVAIDAIKSLEGSKILQTMLLFKHLKLNPSPVQEVCIKLIQAYARLFLCSAAGSGKSDLILAVAIEAATQGHQVIVMNPLLDMLLRDYARLSKYLEQMKIGLEVQLSQGLAVNKLICFMTSQEMLTVQLPEKYHLIVDEFQIELYNEQRVFAFLPAFRKAVSVTAFSGSPVQKQHVEFLQCFAVNAAVIKFPGMYSNNLTEKHAQICPSLRLQVQLAAKLAEQQRRLSPTIMIMEQDAVDMYLKGKIVKAAIQAATVMLCKMSTIEFNQALQTQQFCSTINGLYRIYIVSREHGTGVDYPTTDAINVSGGNNLIVCTKPTSYGELFQFRGRIARMGAPGTVGFIFHDKGDGEDSNYVNSLEQVLRMGEELLMERLLANLQAQHQEVVPQEGEVLFKLDSAEESSNEDMQDENDEDENDEVYVSDEEEKEHQKNSGINMDDYDVCQLCHGKMVAWQDHVCPSKTKPTSVKPIMSAKSKEDDLQQKLRSLDRTEANKGLDFGLDSEEEVYQQNDYDEKKIKAHGDHKEQQQNLEMAEKKSQEENYQMMDGKSVVNQLEEEPPKEQELKELQKPAKKKQSMKNKTKDDMVKLKVDNQEIYLKKVSWEAYLDGKKTTTGKASPTECLMSYLEEEHTTYYENGNIATSSKTKKVEQKREKKRKEKKQMQKTKEENIRITRSKPKSE